MLPLIDTIIGFSVIMLMLSLLVKTLTSVIKNHVDYYSRNLQEEVERLISGTLDEQKQVWGKRAPWLKEIRWGRLREEFLTKENMEWMLRKLGAKEGSLRDLEARLEVHKANIRFVFEKRSKNLSLAVGLALCLFVNINALSIWETLYSDQKVRTKFSSEEYVASVIGMGETTDTEPSDIDAKRLREERERLTQELSNFGKEVDFGVARIWLGDVNQWPGFFYEFFGSLLTGILVSIGAPYWHDLLRALANLRHAKKRGEGDKGKTGKTMVLVPGGVMEATEEETK